MGLGSALSVCLVSLAGRAFAEPGRFGDQHQVVIDQRFNLGGGYARTGEEPIAFSTSELTLSPGASYFVMPKLSVGLHASLGHRRMQAEYWDESATETKVGVAPSIGYAVPIAQHFDVWPQLAVDYNKSWYSGTLNFTGLAQRDGAWLDASLSAPVLWSPAEHFFVGLGPKLAWISGALDNGAFKNDTVAVGATSTIGGYFEP